MVQAQVKVTAAPKAQVTVKKEAPLPTQIDLEVLSGQGMEFITARDTKLPILKVLYPSSPVLEEGPKGSAVRRLKWHVNWVQNVARQFGLYLL